MSNYSDEFIYEIHLIYKCIVGYEMSLRQSEVETGIPKSTIHYRVHHYIKDMSPQAYKEIQKVFNSKCKRKRC